MGEARMLRWTHLLISCCVSRQTRKGITGSGLSTLSDWYKIFSGSLPSRNPQLRSRTACLSAHGAEGGKGKDASDGTVDGCVNKQVTLYLVVNIRYAAHHHRGVISVICWVLEYL
jgi:hypothetical protein